MGGDCISPSHKCGYIGLMFVCASEREREKKGRDGGGKGRGRKNTFRDR